MTLSSARNYITINWLAGSALLLLVVFILTMLGKYRSDPLSGVGWVFQCVTPALGVMIAPITIRIHHHVKGVDLENLGLFKMAIYINWSYFILLHVIIFIQPLTQYTSSQIFSFSGWILGPIQGLIITLVSKFFIEHA